MVLRCQGLRNLISWVVPVLCQNFLEGNWKPPIHHASGTLAWVLKWMNYRFVIHEMTRLVVPLLYLQCRRTTLRMFFPRILNASCVLSHQRRIDSGTFCTQVQHRTAISYYGRIALSYNLTHKYHIRMCDYCRFVTYYCFLSQFFWYFQGTQYFCTRI